MTVQIASVRHELSNIQQSLFVDWDQSNFRRYHMQGVVQGAASGTVVNVYPDETEARAILAAWACLVERGEAELRQIDQLTLSSIFKVEKLADLAAEGERAYEAEYLSQGDCSPEQEADDTKRREYDPESQRDLD